MKKFLSIVMILAVLLSCCACGSKESGKEAATPDAMSPETLYGHIDQTKLIDGFYKIWNAEGFQFLMETGTGNFEILCNIDMEGATLAPIQTFNGMINGGSFKISNFTVQGAGDTDFGFIAVNKGNVQDMVLENVTLLPGENAKNIGAIAGTNEGKINRCTISGALRVEKAAAGGNCGALVGNNAGNISKTVATVDLIHTASGAANVGGMVGCSSKGLVDFTESHGKLTVTGAEKSVGLFAGQAADTEFSSCVFAGADNSLEGKLFTNFTGNADDDETAVAKNAKWRDNSYLEPLPENVMATRQKVVDAMYDLCTVEWKVKEDLVHSCTCRLSVCHGTYNSMYTYVGIPYNHKNSSLARFTYCLNEDKTVFDWFYDLAPYDGYDIYIGSDCSGALQQAWWAVSNSTDIGNTRYLPAVMNKGTIPVGDYKCDFELKSITKNGVATKWTEQYIEVNDEQVMYESYAAMRPGDAIVNQVEAGGHTRMIAADPVIVKDQSGKIDPQYSYVLTHEQGATNNDEANLIMSTCKVNWKYTFANLYADWYCPFTMEELVTGEMEPVEAKLEGGCEGYAGMITGMVKANYKLDSVTLKITDSEGQTVVEHPIFVTAQKSSDYGGNYFAARTYVDNMDLADFAVVLTRVPLEQGGSYSYTLTADLATFDHIVVHEGSFTYGA